MTNTAEKSGDVLTAFAAKVKGTSALYDEITRSHPSLLRGRVWCTRCNSFRQVNVAQALRNGWPKCCAMTMTIDSPAERKVEIKEAK